eukprot:gnl/TRDRNA2_/TRDRNA2_188462_c0_seq1.p1 gnl/TRDRNA2_/TRDRNA2_188462_c0~~gnl/TRDRNA2_/TRDRNA2_188462_c0_seq1.p1  ORF type:complete len:444 (+),score=126.64 gnl/TRDRNA2_/TRDRNA2_188462_c0_seq1:86-1417(+)
MGDAALREKALARLYGLDLCQVLDLDGTGVLSLEVLSRSLKKFDKAVYSEDSVKGMLDIVGCTPRGGSIIIRELAELVQAAKEAGQCTGGLAGPVEKAWLRAIFRQCDVNGDDKIQKGELGKICKLSPDVAAFFGLPLHRISEDPDDPVVQAQIDLLFEIIDGNADRLISWTELCVFYEGRLARGDDGMSLARAAGEKQPSMRIPSAKFQGVKVPPLKGILPAPGDDSSPMRRAPRGPVPPQAKDILKEVYQKAAQDKEGGASSGADQAKKSQLRKTFQRIGRAAVFAGLRQEILAKVAEYVSKNAMEEILLKVGEEVGFEELLDIYKAGGDAESGKGSNAAKRSVTPAEELQLRGVFEQCGVNDKKKIRKEELLKVCKRSLDVAALFALRHNVLEKQLEGVTQEVMNNIFQSLDAAAVAGEEDDCEVSLDDFQEAFELAVQA